DQTVRIFRCRSTEIGGPDQLTAIGIELAKADIDTTAAEGLLERSKIRGVACTEAARPGVDVALIVVGGAMAVVACTVGAGIGRSDQFGIDHPAARWIETLHIETQCSIFQKERTFDR